MNAEGATKPTREVRVIGASRDVGECTLDSTHFGTLNLLWPRAWVGMDGIGPGSGDESIVNEKRGV